MIKNLKLFSLMVIGQFLVYAISVYSWKMVAHDEVSRAMIADGIYSTVQFFVIRRIVMNDNTLWAWAGMVFGGVLGTYVGMKVKF